MLPVKANSFSNLFGAFSDFICEYLSATFSSVLEVFKVVDQASVGHIASTLPLLLSQEGLSNPTALPKPNDTRVCEKVRIYSS